MNFGWHPKNKSGDYIALFVSLGGGFGPCSRPKSISKNRAASNIILFGIS
jgi:hypothetical protein